MNVFVSFVKGYARVNDLTVELSQNKSAYMESLYWNDTAGFIKYKDNLKLLMDTRDFDTYIAPWVNYVREASCLKVA